MLEIALESKVGRVHCYSLSQSFNLDISGQDNLSDSKLIAFFVMILSKDVCNRLGQVIHLRGRPYMMSDGRGEGGFSKI